MLQPLPAVPESDRLQLIEPTADGTYPGMSWREFGDLQERLPSFQHVIAFRTTPLNVGVANQLERAFGFFVSGNYFSGLGLRPRGRPPDRAGGCRATGRGAGDRGLVRVLRQARLAAAPDVVGQTIRVNDRPLTVVGVAPPGFRGTIMGVVFDLWMPATLAPVLVDGSNELTARDVRAYSAIGRLQPDATRARAQSELSAAMQELARAYPSTNAVAAGEVLPIWQAPRGPQRFLTSAIVILQGVMLLVLLAVCGNTANLLLARASTRRERGKHSPRAGCRPVADCASSDDRASGARPDRRRGRRVGRDLGDRGAARGAVAVAGRRHDPIRQCRRRCQRGIRDGPRRRFGAAVWRCLSSHLARLTPGRALRSGTSPGGRCRTLSSLPPSVRSMPASA